MHLMHIGIAAGRERPDQVQGRGGLCVGAQHLFRVGNTGVGGKGELVDDVTAVAWQFHPIHRFSRR